MQIHIDLNTRIVSKDQQIYVARPGKGYRLYADFIKDEVVAADLPALELEDGLPLAQQPDLDRKIRRSRTIRSWYRRRGSAEDAPPRDLDSYTEASADKSIQTLRGVLSGFFERLAMGDLVLVPPSAYSQPTYVGEVISSPNEYTTITAPKVYGPDFVTGRRVKWLAQIEKRKLPDEILDALEHPTSIYLLARSQRALIYESAFGSYVDLSSAESDFTARFFVRGEKFTTSSDFLLQAFFNFVASNEKAIEEGATAAKRFYDAAFDDLGNYAPELKTNVNSPGFLTLLSGYKTPLVAAVLLAVALQVGDGAVGAAREGRIVIGNSKAPPHDICTAEVAKSVMMQMQMIDLTEWPKACEVARRAADKTGVTGTIRVEQKP